MEIVFLETADVEHIHEREVIAHGGLDGNKRAGFASALAFLDLNGYEVELDQDAAYDLVIGVCEGDITKRRLAAALREHAAPLEG